MPYNYICELYGKVKRTDKCFGSHNTFELNKGPMEDIPDKYFVECCGNCLHSELIYSSK